MKSFKREYAAILMVMLGWTWWEGDTVMLEVLLAPALAFVATACGMHMYFKDSGSTKGEK